VLRLVLVESLWLVAFGIVAGVGIAMAGGRVVSSLVFGLPPTDLTTMGAAAVILASVAVFAGYLPARRASRVDPLVALRYE
jgi:ABC-type antimicrobial peptide transport system permease subunit